MMVDWLLHGLNPHVARKTRRIISVLQEWRRGRQEVPDCENGMAFNRKTHEGFAKFAERIRKRRFSPRSQR